MAEAVDIAVVGGGLSAASCALALARCELPLRVVLVAPGPPPPVPVADFDAPSIALSQGSVDSYVQLGLWPALADTAAAIERVHVSRRGVAGSVLMDARDVGRASLGQVVEHQSLRHGLWQCLLDSPVELLCAAQLESCRPRRDGFELSVSMPGAVSRQLRPGLVIAADGADSPLAAQLGIERRRRDYGHSALLCNIDVSGLPRGTAWERFSGDGAVALLPLAAMAEAVQRMLLVASVPTARCAELAMLDDGGLARWLAQVMAVRELRLHRVGVRRQRPLWGVTAAEQWRPGLLLLGDAAHVLHPVAAQGFNLGLRGVMMWARHLERALAAGELPASAAVLSRYVAGRRADQRWVSALSGALHHGLVVPRLPAALVGVGLAALELAAPLKSRFLARAAGF